MQFSQYSDIAAEFQAYCAGPAIFLRRDGALGAAGAVVGGPDEAALSALAGPSRPALADPVPLCACFLSPEWLFSQMGVGCPYF